MVSFILIGLMLMGSVYGTGSTSGKFSDVASDHWAHDAIEQMVKYGVINGYDDGTFKPNQSVKRDEFSTMMVKSLNLAVDWNAKSSFADMDDSYWAVPYVETAKYYLTGYKSGSQVLFKPQSKAVREDMAVALVKALGYENASYDLNDLDVFEDEDDISSNLKKYVAIALDKGIMSGSESGSKRYFNPENAITRAESAVLLNMVITDENIDLDGEKITFEDMETTPVEEPEVVVSADYATPNVRVYTDDGQVTLKWDKISSSNLDGYKVVASKYNSQPAYPSDGYYKWITNSDTTSITIKNGAGYNGGDVGQFKSGETYYFSITAVYKDRKIAGNAVAAKMTGEAVDYDLVKPSLSVKETDGKLKLYWNEISNNQLSGYKVVASKSDGSPAYPDNGYKKWITDASRTYEYVAAGDGYNGGDVGSFQGGEKYYFAITAIYNDGSKLTSNVVQYQVPGSSSSVSYGDYITPKLTVTKSDGMLKLTWNQIDHGKLNGYKVVASKSDSTPIYPDNGYKIWITDKTKTYETITSGESYKNGDFSKFESGETYYLSITAVYNDKKVAGNVVKITMP